MLLVDKPINQKHIQVDSQKGLNATSNETETKLKLNLLCKFQETENYCYITVFHQKLTQSSFMSVESQVIYIFYFWFDLFSHVILSFYLSFGTGGRGGLRDWGKGVFCGNVPVKIMSIVICFKILTCLLLSVVVEVALHPRI